MNRTEFANHLSWNEKNVWARLNALGLLGVCTRCLGSGNYSFCPMYGHTCFKCRGSGKQLPRLTKKLLLAVSERVAAGGLDEYLARCARIAQAKRALPGLIEAAQAVYRVISDVYSETSRKGLGAIDERLSGFQTRANGLFWGYGASGHLIHPRALGIREVQTMAERGEVRADWAAERIQMLTEQLRELASEFQTRAVAA